MKIIPYTSEQKDKMCQIYQDTRSISEIQKEIPANWITIRKILINRGIYNPRKQKWKRFTEEEKVTIVSNYPSITYFGIAKMLGCTPKAVADFLRSKGLYQSQSRLDHVPALREMASNGICLKDAAETLSISYSSAKYFAKTYDISFERGSPWGPERKDPVYKAQKWLTDEEKKRIKELYLSSHKLTQTAKAVERDIWSVRRFLIKEGLYQKKNLSLNVIDEKNDQVSIIISNENI